MRRLREIYLRPFQTIMKETEVGAVMPSHNEIDGVPSHGNTWLLRDLLRGEWGWTKGLISSDYGDVAGLMGYHIVGSIEDAAVMGLTAGVEMELGAASFPTLVNSTRNGKGLPSTATAATMSHV